MDGGSRYPSRVDNQYGKAFVRGYEYMARLQYLPDNPTLCKPAAGPETFNLTHVPPDHLPGGYTYSYIDERVGNEPSKFSLLVCSRCYYLFFVLLNARCSGAVGSSHRMHT
jgi:hypothetical protein